ncbi:3-dehydrosphinganine reductase, partial [Perkinsus olseni]
TSSLESDLAAERERSASLEARLEDTAAKVAEFQAMLERNQARASAQKEEASSVTGGSPDASREVEQLRTRVEELELELKRAARRRRAGEEGLLIESSKEDESEDTREKWARYEEMQLELVSLEEDLQGQLRVNEELKASSSAEKEAMVKELEGLRAEMANLAEANEELRRAAEGLQAREDQLNRRLALSWEGAEGQRTRLAEELQGKLDELQEKLNAVEEEKKVRASDREECGGPDECQRWIDGQGERTGDSA